MMMFFDPDNLPEGMPEEMQNSIRDHVDKHNMSQQAGAHEMNMLFDDLNEEQLKSVNKLIIYVTTGGPGVGNYYLGRIDSLLLSKFDVCSCGQKHDPNAEFAAVVDPVKFTEEVVKVIAEDEEIKPGDSDVITPSIVAQMRDWDLAYDSSQKIRCVRCGLQYVSLADRMLKPDCHGCQKMSSNGSTFGPRPDDYDW